MQLTVLRIMKIAIYTAIYDNYEILRDSIIVDGVDYICFSDDLTLKSDIWNIRYLRNTHKSGLGSMFVKYIKLNSQRYLRKYDYVIWIDANIVIKNKDFLKYFANKLFSTNIILFKHHDPNPGLRRNCAYKEAEFSRIHLDKYSDENISDQINNYKQNGFPEEWGLFQSGVFMKNNKCKAVLNFDRAWLHEIYKYGKRFPQCQVSLPYVLWLTKITFNIISNPSIYESNLFDIHPHRKTYVNQFCS